MAQFDVEKVRKMANGIRRRVLEITIAKNGCYLSQALSSAEILSSLYGGIMKLGASQAPLRLQNSVVFQEKQIKIM